MKLIIETKSPLSHGAFGGNDLGNYMMFRRINLVNVPDTPQIPVISGNAIRGTLRRLIMTDLYNKAGMTFDIYASACGIDNNTKIKRNWDRLWAALYNGGTIETPDNNINPENLRELRKSIVPLSLFGSALYSIMLNGMVTVGFAYPYCKETIEAGIFEDKGQALPANNLLEDIGLTRHIDRENADPNNTGVKPMPYEVETLATGTILKADITFLPMATPIERSCMAYSIELLNNLGGKTSIGFGKLTAKTVEQTENSELYKEWLDTAPLLDNLINLAAAL